MIDLFLSLCILSVIIICSTSFRSLLLKRHDTKIYYTYRPEQQRLLQADIPGEKIRMKSVIINQKQKDRINSPNFSYGLKNVTNYPVLNKELESFLHFMTEYGINSQEDPIRIATAEPYIRQAKLFIGWYLTNQKLYDKLDLSIEDIFKTKQKESAQPIVSYIQWLKNKRKSSPSYISNVLRGLGKLVKFRFSGESQHEKNGKSYDDIPIVRELRRQHTVTSRVSRNAPRISDEKKKWITWEEYLDVINKVKIDTDRILMKYQNTTESSLKEYAAYSMQKFLILSFFSQVPDRQRTFRELDLDKTFLREGNQWIIKHGPVFIYTLFIIHTHNNIDSRMITKLVLRMEIGHL